ncbi:MAG: bifunctional riboflavin kinase/FAD synthetase [Acidobacteriaceae bacterium]
MQVFRKLEELPPNFGPTVVTIGNFDGVHRGHQWVIAETIERARLLGAKSLAVTFDPHPTRVLRPQFSPKLITPLEEKLVLLAATGIDATLVLPFTRQMSLLTAREFATSTLRDSLHAVEIHEGENFRFGHAAEAGVESLSTLGQELGFTVKVYAPRKLRGEAVSSSRIRELISAGDMHNARHLLGRAFSVLGRPASGRGLGTRHTVPTINLADYDELLPAHGVYITCMRVGEEVFESVTNIGNRPTFGEDSFAVESHLLNFHPLALTPETPLTLTFLKKLRPEMRWPTPEALKAQILKDVTQAQRYFRHLRAELKYSA